MPTSWLSMPGGLLCSPRISSWHDVSGESMTGAIWDMMIKVTVFKLVGKIIFFCEHSVNCELLYITGVGDEG